MHPCTPCSRLLPLVASFSSRWLVCDQVLEARCVELDTAALEARHGTGLRFRQLCDDESKLRRQACELGVAREAAQAAYDRTRSDAERLEREHAGAFAMRKRHYIAPDEQSVAIRARGRTLREAASKLLTAAKAAERKFNAHEQRIAEVETAIMNTKGYFSVALRRCMQQHKVVREAHYGGVLGGAACDRVLKNAVALGRLLRERRLQGRKKEVRLGDNVLGRRVTHLFISLRGIFPLLGRATPLCGHEVEFLRIRIWNFACLWHRWMGPDRRNVTPKLHKLTYHAAAFARRWQTVGMMSEQSIERAHRCGNKLARQFCTMAVDGARLRAMFQQAQLQSNPAVAALQRPHVVCASCHQPIGSNAHRFDCKSGAATHARRAQRRRAAAHDD